MMNLTRKHISFERVSSADDFKRKLKIGRIAQIEKWFDDLGISSDRYTIDKDFNINVRGNLDLRGTKITLLPNDLSIEESLFLSGTNITSLPNDLSVGRDIWLDKDKKGKVYVPEHLKKKIEYLS